jgi:hypothetical protein
VTILGHAIKYAFSSTFLFWLLHINFCSTASEEKKEVRTDFSLYSTSSLRVVDYVHGDSYNTVYRCHLLPGTEPGSGEKK